MLHPQLQAERDAVSGCLTTTVKRLQQLRPLISLDKDIEVLHDFRVELRRLRTVLRAFRGALPAADSAWLEDECRWLAGTSSGLRDADVLMHQLEGYAQDSGSDAAAHRSLAQTLKRIRGRERTAALRSLRSRRTDTLMAALEHLRDLPVLAPEWPARPVLARACDKTLRRVIADGAAIDAAAPADALHALRKRTKRLRYLLELQRRPFTGKHRDDLLRRLRKLQNDLGEFQDLSAHGAVLKSLETELQERPQTLALLAGIQAAMDERSAVVRERALRRFAELSDSGSRRSVAKRLKRSCGLGPPLLGTHGYCHGFASGELAGLNLGKIVCVGRNYAAHAAELGNPVPERPLLFIKPPSAAVDFGPRLRIPAGCGSVHHEIEIAVLIGRELCRARPEAARRAIAGIGLAIDLTLRDVQDELKAKSHPWEIAKGFDGAAALGPFVPLDPDLNLETLELRLAVNGRRRQAGSSAQMLTPIIELLCLASHHFSLWPGDVVLTGTPSGVGPLVAGDRLSAELVGLSRLRSVIVG